MIRLPSMIKVSKTTSELKKIVLSARIVTFDPEAGTAESPQEVGTFQYFLFVSSGIA